MNARCFTFIAFVNADRVQFGIPGYLEWLYGIYDLDTGSGIYDPDMWGGFERFGRNRRQTRQQQYKGGRGKQHTVHIWSFEQSGCVIYIFDKFVNKWPNPPMSEGQ
jgi:hypothetical protein